MNQEQLIALALPHSVAAEPHDGFHVSVFLTPKLLPDGAGATLADFPTLRSWASLAASEAGIEIGLVTQNAVIRAKIVRKAVTDDWTALFPSDTPVAQAGPKSPASVPNWSGKDWASYPAAETANYAKSLLLTTILAGPVTPVTPQQHPLSRPIVDYFRDLGAIDGEYEEVYDQRGRRMWPPRLPASHLPPEPNERRRGQSPAEFKAEQEAYRKAFDDAHAADLAWEAWLEEREKRIILRALRPQDLEIRETAVTNALDAERAARTPSSPRSALGDLPAGTALDQQVAAAISDLHETRRFYEEPDPTPDSSRLPENQKKPEPLPSPLPEFHKRVAAAGDHPQLLRQLGLVLDLVVEDPALLRKADWLAVRMRVQDAQADLVRSPKVWVRALKDRTFVVVPRAEREAEWLDGQLALGKPELFSVLDVDPDGSALKAERFVVSLPRMLKVQANNDQIDAAAPALRATGLAVTRTDQLAEARAQFDRQSGFQAGLESAPDPLNAPSVYVHDVTRGLRIEVFDASTQRWYSLHTRLSTVALGTGAEPPTAYIGREEEGFIQGTTAHETPNAAKPTVKIHESVFGWDGWSLSAPRPGDRVRGQVVRNRDDTGWTIEEKVEPSDTAVAGQKPPHPLSTTASVKPKSLPRLRYGRRYAFRAWIVDLAGNVRPHSLELEGGPDGSEIRPLLTKRRLPGLLELHRAQTDSGAASVGLRAAALEVAALSAGQRTTGPSRDDVRARLAEAFVSDDGVPAEIDALADAVVAAATTSPAIDLGEPIRVAAAGLDPVPKIRAIDDAHLDEVAALVATQLERASYTTALVRRTLDGTTPLRAFLRWDPVPSPAVVARSVYTEGESLRVVVVRSGVTQERPGAEPGIVAPKAFAKDAADRVTGGDAGAPHYRDRAERHLAAPQTSQQQAELHGAFDGSIDGPAKSATTAQHEANREKQLAWALRESGTFFDTKRAPLDRPSGVWSEQEGVELITPSAAADRHVADTAGRVPPRPHAKVEGDESEPVVPHGDTPAPGAYVVHDTDHLELPYLPDPLATGVSLRFLDAGSGLRADPPRAVHLTTTPYRGEWPDIKPFRLSLTAGAALDASVSGRDIEIALPAGTTQRFVLASTIDDGGLDRLGVWDALDPQFTQDDAVAQAARDGLIWGLTPGELVTLVHAVPRPVAIPVLGQVLPYRKAGWTQFAPLAMAYVHAASTEQLSAETRWVEVSDVGERGALRRTTTDVAFTTRVQPDESAILLWTPALPIPGIHTHDSTHAFADTRHRFVEYVLRASTRYREYFHPDLIAPPERDAPAPGVDDQWPIDDGKSLLSVTTVIDIPSSTPPPPPVINSVIPLFRWEDAEEPDQPFARRRVRRAGLRVYLERGWFASGDGELLAVLLGLPLTPENEQPDDVPFVSQWGSDPAWDGAMVSTRRLDQTQFRTFADIADPSRQPDPGRPVRFDPLVPVRRAAEDTDPRARAIVSAVSYEPHFNVDRQLWYVDIVFDSAATQWPFVRLALARFQPSSVDGCHLSTPVRADFIQLPPERTLTVGRPDASRVSVSVLGEYGHRKLKNRSPQPENQDLAFRDEGVVRSNHLVASLQRRNPIIGGDLGWTTMAATDLVIGGHGARDTQALWVGIIDLPEPLDLRRPLASELDTAAHAVPAPDMIEPTEPLPVTETGLVNAPPSEWRVRVEEWVQVPSDPPAGIPDTVSERQNVWERRLVYADDVYL